MLRSPIIYATNLLTIQSRDPGERGDTGDRWLRKAKSGINKFEKGDVCTLVINYLNIHYTCNVYCIRVYCTLYTVQYTLYSTVCTVHEHSRFMYFYPVSCI